MFIFHITSASDWEKARLGEFYQPASLDHEGFIHCSTADQALAVGESYYRGLSGLVLLKIDPDKLEVEVKFEDSHHNGELFPHIYGPLAVKAVVGFAPFTPASDGKFTWPQNISKD